MLKHIQIYDKKILKEAFLLSLPIILSNISRVAMELVDMIMINNLGAINLFNGVSMGGILIWVPMSLAIGIRIATQTISSRRYGEKKHHQCGFALRHGLIIGAIMGSILSVLGYLLAETIVPSIVSHKEHIEPTIEYAKYLSIGILPFYLACIFQGFFTSIEKTSVHMRVMITANIINVYLNAGFIYGSEIINYFNSANFDFISHLWFWADSEILNPGNSEGLKVKGSAIATTIATSFMLVHYIYYLFKDNITKKYCVLVSTINWKNLKRHFYIASPLFASEFFLSTSYLAFYIIMENMTQTNFAAWGLILRIMHASFLPAMGIGQACATMVGKYLGEGSNTKARQSIAESLKLATGMMGFVGLVFILFPYNVINIFNIGLEEATPLAANGLRFVGIFQIFDAICIVLFFSMSAGGDIKYPVYIEILMHWLIMVPLSWLFGIYLGYGFWGAISVFAGQVVFTAIIFIFRIQSGKWEKIEV
ncbi:MAG: hypothetical protein CMG13_06155 [Candidatus Marinimicrobia bacterium]|nr:hypothetical protein [Candidatus Neomarinimicrobiota bacterium]